MEVGSSPMCAANNEGKTMTKHVRIENADTSTHKVRVRVYNKTIDAAGSNDVLVETYNLDHPTQMLTAMIHSGRYIVIDEPDMS